MKILIAEDQRDLLDQYKAFLENSGHEVVTALDGAQCLYLYAQECKKHPNYEDLAETIFDSVVLDYQMPKMNGLDTAKEILAINPHQRIIFASGFLQETLTESITNLKQIVELLQKPFPLQALADTIEDKEIYKELEKLNVDIRNLKEIKPTHAQISNYLEVLTKLQKGRAF